MTLSIWGWMGVRKVYQSFEHIFCGQYFRLCSPSYPEFIKPLGGANVIQLRPLRLVVERDVNCLRWAPSHLGRYQCNAIPPIEDLGCRGCWLLVHVFAHTPPTVIKGNFGRGLCINTTTIHHRKWKEIIIDDSFLELFSSKHEFLYETTALFLRHIAII